MGWTNAGGWGGHGWGRAAAGASYDAATTAWANAVVSAGGTVSTTQKGYVDTLITSLKTNSLWTKLDRLWLYASENATQAKIDLVSLASHTVHGTPTFTTSQGYTANGSAYIDTGANPSSLTQYTQNSASFGFYSRAIETATFDNGSQTGVYDASTNVLHFQNQNGSNGQQPRINEGFNGQWQTTPSGVGLNVVTRTGASAEALYYYLSTGSGSVSQTNASTGVPNGPVYVLALDNNSSGTPTASSFATVFQCAMFFLGGGLTSTDAANMSARVNAYMTSLGTNVY